MSFTKNAPDEEAVRLLRYYEGLALRCDARGYCVCTSPREKTAACWGI
ncbi:hypothetical protein [Ruthenibacterium lactatiformans]